MNKCDISISEDFLALLGFNKSPNKFVREDTEEKTSYVSYELNVDYWYLTILFDEVKKEWFYPAFSSMTYPIAGIYKISTFSDFLSAFSADKYNKGKDDIIAELKEVRHAAQTFLNVISESESLEKKGDKV